MAVAVLLLALVALAGGNEEPVFRSLLRSHTATKGSDVTLKCAVDNLGDRTISWRRVRDAYPISVGHTYFSPKRKYQTRYDAASGEWSLTIRQVQRDDAGEYECRVTGNGHYTNTLELSLTDRVTHFAPAPRAVLARLGDTVTLPCTVRNLQRHLVMWRNSKGEIIAMRKKNYSGNRRYRVQKSGDDWNLRIKAIQESDLGPYMCIVNSDPILTRTVTLRHDGPLPTAPEFVREGFQKTRHVREGDPLTITCRFTGFPSPRISWYRKVQRDGRSVKEDLKEKSATLTFSSVKVEDAGRYTCNARNGKAPSARGRVTITVEPLPTTEPPRTTPPVPTGPTPPRIYAVEERVGGRKGWHADMECVAVGDPIPHVHWRRHGQVIRNDFQHRVSSSSRDRHTAVTSLRVRSLLNPHFGEYECHAANQYGTHSARVELYDITGK